ncbi:MAG: hypothetical protein GY742_00335, partial [Hyphomicrobiales bacterium]|nr:hypothetical protein [Hyphomicrobiales bacterium]
MTVFSNIRIANQDDLARFEEEKTLDQRLPETSILDVFVNQAAARPEHTAITMLMSG